MKIFFLFQLISILLYPKELIVIEENAPIFKESRDEKVIGRLKFGEKVLKQNAKIWNHKIPILIENKKVKAWIEEKNTSDFLNWKLIKYKDISFYVPSIKYLKQKEAEVYFKSKTTHYSDYTLYLEKYGILHITKVRLNFFALNMDEIDQSQIDNGVSYNFCLDCIAYPFDGTKKIEFNNWIGVFDVGRDIMYPEQNFRLIAWNGEYTYNLQLCCINNQLLLTPTIAKKILFSIRFK
ncbi:MAG: hypothetical protein KBF99_18445 [Leptospiraceae bacterium]|nr:hypothetical protein [Leptospiraceae bacterium]MBK7054450.1 hypothetical protein [Leptospiraceae bacterium]MBK9498819.1 hypothetical protein [Leptospiraceae bacterium]MBL0262692.1 hypothetical protein [Leptospiraceae bacterium]MBP9165167.1 hypothetical protein [Leptospiraceae bacterium]